jgi:hypothetical protein
MRDADNGSLLRKGCALGLTLAMAGCSFGEDEKSSPSGPRLASGRPLPARCTAQPVPKAATVTFVANGRAWALDPRGGGLTCLFPVRQPGPFAWGPRGDRALLASLEVKGIADAPRRAPTSVDPPASSWGRPIGKSIVFVGRGGRALLKAHPAGGGFTDVTPVRGARYRNVVYHPSGLAFAFVLRRRGLESLWMSTNTGLEPRMLVHGRSHTGFGLVAFGRSGNVLYFTASHRDGRTHVHSLQLADPRFAGVVWRSEPGERVTDLFVGWRHALALTVGRSCGARRVVIVGGPRGYAADDPFPDEHPSRALGWLDGRDLLVGVGGCGEPLDLYSVEAGSLKRRLLVRGVEAASVRRPERFPPPELPHPIRPDQQTPA